MRIQWFAERYQLTMEGCCILTPISCKVTCTYSAQIKMCRQVAFSLTSLVRAISASMRATKTSVCHAFSSASCISFLFSFSLFSFSLFSFSLFSFSLFSFSFFCFHSFRFHFFRFHCFRFHCFRFHSFRFHFFVFIFFVFIFRFVVF